MDTIINVRNDIQLKQVQCILQGFALEFSPKSPILASARRFMCVLMVKIHLLGTNSSLWRFRNQTAPARARYGQPFPTVLATLPVLTLKINQQMYLTYRPSSRFPFAFPPFQRKCFWGKAGCYGSFIVDHFSRRLENIQPFQITWFMEHSQVHYNENEEEETDEVISNKTMQLFAYKWTPHLSNQNFWACLILTNFSSQATFTDDGISEK